MAESTGSRSRVRAEEILQAAANELTEHGIAAFRPRNVAERLGVSSGLIHYHFAKKDDLIAAAFKREAQRQLDQLAHVDASAANTEERLLGALRVYGPADTASAWRLWIDAWSESMRNDRLRETMLKLSATWAERVRLILDDAVAEGRFAVSDTASATRELLAWLDGESVRIVLEWPSVGTEPPEARLHRLIMQRISSWR